MANVLNFTCDDYPKDLIRSIFDHQHALAEKYLPIEKSNGLCQYDLIPADIDNAKAQARIKDMSWRAIEEAAEAFEALGKDELIHFYEELADTLHFLVEKYLLCDYLPVGFHTIGRYTEGDRKASLASFFEFAPNPTMSDEKPSLSLDTLRIYLAKFVTASGLSCNCLKNKPWKQSQMMTDENKFRILLHQEFISFIDLCSAAGYTEKTLYDMYIRKNQVNQFRQRSNY